PALRAFPGAVLELAPDGVVLASNGRLESELERALAGRPLADALDRASALKLDELLRRGTGEAGGRPAAWARVLEARDALPARAFYPVGDEGDGERMWLVECPADPRFSAVHDELAAVNSEQASTQRQLAKEKARLGRALDELERELGENSRL